MERIVHISQRKPGILNALRQDWATAIFWYNRLAEPVGGNPPQAELVISREKAPPETSLERFDVNLVIQEYSGRGYRNLAKHSKVIFDYLKSKGH